MVSARPLPEESLQRLRDDVLVRYAHETTAIEGNTLSLEETKIILQDGISVRGKPLRDHFEVISIHRALIWLETSSPLANPSVKRPSSSCTQS